MDVWPVSTTCLGLSALQRPRIASTASGRDQARKVLDSIGALSGVYKVEVHPVEVHQLFDLLGEPIVYLVDVEGGSKDSGDLIHQGNFCGVMLRCLAQPGVLQGSGSLGSKGFGH